MKILIQAPLKNLSDNILKQIAAELVSKENLKLAKNGLLKNQANTIIYLEVNDDEISDTDQINIASECIKRGIEFNPYNKNERYI